MFSLGRCYPFRDLTFANGLKPSACESEQAGLKYQQPPCHDRKDDEPEVVQFKLSLASFHYFLSSQGAFLNLIRELDGPFLSFLRRNDSDRTDFFHQPVGLNSQNVGRFSSASS